MCPVGWQSSTQAVSKKKKSENVKCVFCDGNHPANYKRAVPKDLQKRTSPTLRNEQEEKISNSYRNNKRKIALVP
jgi:hypothetical protein